MTVEERLTAEMNAAMKARKQDVLDCIRMVKTRLSEKRTSPGFTGGITDAVALEVIDAYSRMLKKAIAEFEAAGSGANPVVEKYRFEVAYLADYLPKKLDEQQTRALVKQVATELGLSGPSAVGRLMGALMKGHKDVLDSALVKRLCEEELLPRPNTES